MELTNEQWAVLQPLIPQPRKRPDVDGGFLYTGYTQDLERRFREHLAGRGGMFTKLNRPVRMVYHETYATQRAALRREREIKRLSRAEKEELIGGSGGG